MSSQDSRDQQSLWLSVSRYDSEHSIHTSRGHSLSSTNPSLLCWHLANRTVSSSGDHDGNAQADQTPFPSIELPYTLARYLDTPARDDPFSTYVLRDGSVAQSIINLLSLCVRLRRNMEDVRADLAGLGAQFWYT